MEEKLLTRLVVAFERIATAQEQQSEYLAVIGEQNAVQYEKYDDWRVVDEQLNREAGERKEREVQLAELTREFERALLVVKLEQAELAPEDREQFRELLRRYGSAV